MFGESIRYLIAAALTAGALAGAASADEKRRGYSYADDYGARGGITLYDGAGFRGEAVSFSAAVAQLPRARFNDRAGSVAVQGGSWELCSDSNFRGHCEIVSGDIGDLRRISLNNNISSIRPANRGYGGGRGGYAADGYGRRGGADVILYDGSDFTGRSLPVSGALPRLGDVRGNDKASSIEILRGSWLVCEHANFKGRCAVIDRSTRDLRRMGLNNNISSIRPVGGSDRRNWR